MHHPSRDATGGALKNYLTMEKNCYESPQVSEILLILEGAVLSGSVDGNHDGFGDGGVDSI